MSADERAVQHRRFKLSSSAKAECALLDRRLLGLERVEQESTGDDKTETQKKLFEARLRSREIGC